LRPFLFSGGLLAFAYHLPDALGSVRQLTNAGANVTLALSYEPFGNMLTNVGTGATNYNFAGEFCFSANSPHQKRTKPVARPLSLSVHPLHPLTTPLLQSA